MDEKIIIKILGTQIFISIPDGVSAESVMDSINTLEDFKALLSNRLSRLPQAQPRGDGD